MSLATIAEETVEISRRGWYFAPPGERVTIGDAVERAMAGTRLHRPQGDDPFDIPSGEVARPVIEVTPETTSAAARRLVEREGNARVAALNFASARNPGGGFLGGARAQEEDLARCSALYVCQLRQPTYYEENRACTSMLYTDHLIYSPDVPFFRDDGHALLPAPFLLSVLTSPAPNAGEAKKRGDGGGVRETLERRAHQVLSVAAHHRHSVLVLGAWGCGVFRNDPRAVAEVFARLLGDVPFATVFSRVVFAVYDRSKEQATYRAFAERFGVA
jgi:uncharacterized protein (TIGR02452 family)